MKDPVKYLKENGWRRADFTFINRDSAEEYKDQELECFYDYPIHSSTIELVEENDEEVVFKGEYIIAASMVGHGEEPPAITKGDTEVKVIFRKSK